MAVRSLRPGKFHQVGLFFSHMIFSFLVCSNTPLTLPLSLEEREKRKGVVETVFFQSAWQWEYKE